MVIQSPPTTSPPIRTVTVTVTKTVIKTVTKTVTATVTVTEMTARTVIVIGISNFKAHFAGIDPWTIIVQ